MIALLVAAAALLGSLWAPWTAGSYVLFGALDGGSGRWRVAGWHELAGLDVALAVLAGVLAVVAFFAARRRALPRVVLAALVVACLAAAVVIALTGLATTTEPAPDGDRETVGPGEGPFVALGALVLAVAALAGVALGRRGRAAPLGARRWLLVAAGLAVGAAPHLTWWSLGSFFGDGFPAWFFGPLGAVALVAGGTAVALAATVRPRRVLALLPLAVAAVVALDDPRPPFGDVGVGAVVAAVALLVAFVALLRR